MTSTEAGSGVEARHQAFESAALFVPFDDTRDASQVAFAEQGGRTRWPSLGVVSGGEARHQAFESAALFVIR
jgi:hypothetical protein